MEKIAKSDDLPYKRNAGHRLPPDVQDYGSNTRHLTKSQWMKKYIASVKAHERVIEYNQGRRKTKPPSKDFALAKVWSKMYDQFPPWGDEADDILDARPRLRRNKRAGCRGKTGKFLGNVPQCLGSRASHAQAMNIMHSEGISLGAAWKKVKSQGKPKPKSKAKAKAKRKSTPKSETMEQLKLFNPSKGITRKSAFKNDQYYTLWLRMTDGYYVIERSFVGRHIKDVVWSDIQQYNKRNKRQYVFFPQGYNPNE